MRSAIRGFLHGLNPLGYTGHPVLDGAYLALVVLAILLAGEAALA